MKEALKMKKGGYIDVKKRSILLVLFAVLAFSVSANAIPTTIGTALYGGTNYNMIYEEDSPFGPVTWLDYTRGADSWSNQVTWASGLGGSLTVSLIPGCTTAIDWTSGWRLPETVDGKVDDGYDGKTFSGYNITTSELGYLFYESLGNKGYYDTNGLPQAGYGLLNTGDFNNLQASRYWSGTEYSLIPGGAWFFSFESNPPEFCGYQASGVKDNWPSCALAVRPGQVSCAPVPEPATMLLLSSGLIGLVGFRRKFRNLSK